MKKINYQNKENGFTPRDINSQLSSPKYDSNQQLHE